MDNESSSEEGEAQLSSGQNSEGEAELDVELEKAIADDFSIYDCFMQPFHSLDEGEENKKQQASTCTSCDRIEEASVDEKFQVRLVRLCLMTTASTCMFTTRFSYFVTIVGTVLKFYPI